MSKSRVIPPKVLGKKAREKYASIVKSLPPLDVNQLDLATMLADAYETWLQVTEELAEYVDKTGSLIVQGSTGQPKEHPLLKVQDQQRKAYIDVFRQLRLSLAGEENVPDSDRLDDILGG